jgi:hypothetical protein
VLPDLLAELASCKDYLIYALSVVIDVKKMNDPLWRIVVCAKVRAYQGTIAYRRLLGIKLTWVCNIENSSLFDSDAMRVVYLCRYVVER